MHIIGPKEFMHALTQESVVSDRVFLYEDTKTKGAALAINQVLESPLVPFQDFFTWLGDDDEFYSSKVYTAVKRLELDRNSVAVFGEVEYVDVAGKIILVNPGPRIPSLSLALGPQKIAQPGSVFRSVLLHQIGPLDPSYICAWDQDYFARAAKMGKIMRVPDRVARYYWGEGTLSVSNLERSLAESARIRLFSMPRLGAMMWMPIELARIVFVLILGTRLTPSKSLRKTYHSMKICFGIVLRRQNASL